VRRPSLKDLAKQVIERQPISGEADIRRAIAKAIEAARLVDYRAALLLGRLHLCGNCVQFTFGPDIAGSGSCALFGDGLVPFAMPFYCSKFQASATPAAPSFLPDEDGTMAIERELAKPVLPADLPFNDPIPYLVGGAGL
jgi:hypothetical protein